MPTPKFWLIAGPNGSGKSTFSTSSVFDRLTSTPEHATSLVRLNPDAVARNLAEKNFGLTTGDLDLRAAQEVDQQVDALIEAGTSFLAETVLSTDKYEPKVRRAKDRGYWFGLVYVLLRNPDLNVARVAQRVAQGGHDVPEGKIRDRWGRSLERLPTFARLADAFSIWDNSSASTPALLIEATAVNAFISLEAELIAHGVSAPQPLRASLRSVMVGLKGK